jgi:hypothetical protein
MNNLLIFSVVFVFIIGGCFLADDDRQCGESKDDENSEQLQDALGERVRQHDFLSSHLKGKSSTISNSEC